MSPSIHRRRTAGHIRGLAQFGIEPLRGQQIAAKHPPDRAFIRRERPTRVTPCYIERPRAIAQRPTPTDHGNRLVRLVIAIAGKGRLSVIARLDQNAIGRTRGVARDESRMDRSLGIGEITVRAKATIAVITGHAIDMDRRTAPDRRVDQIAWFNRRAIVPANLFDTNIKAHPIPTEPRRKSDRYPATVCREWVHSDSQH